MVSLSSFFYLLLLQQIFQVIIARYGAQNETYIEGWEEKI